MGGRGEARRELESLRGNRNLTAELRLQAQGLARAARVGREAGIAQERVITDTTTAPPADGAAFSLSRIQRLLLPRTMATVPDKRISADAAALHSSSAARVTGRGAVGVAGFIISLPFSSLPYSHANKRSSREPLCHGSVMRQSSAWRITNGDKCRTAQERLRMNFFKDPQYLLGNSTNERPIFIE